MERNQSLEQPLMVGAVTVDEAIATHLETCVQCRNVAEHSGPVRLGQHSGHCGGYWQLQLMRANHEGRVNNVVAHTEHGDEAPKLGRLE